MTLSNDTDDVVTVNFATADGTAVAGTDYVAQSGTLTFQPGVTSQVITLVVNPAAAGEGIEWLTVNLTGAANAIIGDGVAMVTIVPPTSWLTTTAAEFGAGTLDAGSYVANTSGGEVTLAPTVSAEFDGTALPAGWTSGAVINNGTTTVANGWVIVEGSSVLAPTTYSSGRSLEFSAIFTGEPGQHAGFGLTASLLPPYALFGTKVDGSFYTRTNGGGQAIDTPIPGNWFNAPHRFRIDWNATNVVFWIDGTQVATHTVTYAVKMRPAMTDVTLGGGGLAVDWMRMSNYSASGVYTSPVYNAAASGRWLSASWVADLPAGTTVAVAVRTGNSSSPDAAGSGWSAWTPVAQPGGAIAGTPLAQYAQYKLTLTTSVPNATPSVKEVVLNVQR